jgi:hypothetical protein
VWDEEERDQQNYKISGLKYTVFVEEGIIYWEFKKG